MSLEFRSYNFDIGSEKRDDGIGVLTGQPVVYNSPTDIGGMFREIIDAGALNETDLRDVVFLVNHNDKMIPAARSRRNNGNSTMQMSINERGLYLDKVELDIENNSESRALYSAVDRGDLDGMSFRFSVTQERWEDLDTDYPTRHVEKIGKIVELSAVTFPAYDATSIQARNADALENARVALDNAKKEARSLDSDKQNDELALLKAKTLIIGGI